MMENSQGHGGRGRPRGFEPEAALEAAMRLFWARGYEATSMSDLVEALGLNRASLYGAFGDKESLFLKALERYGARFTAGPLAALDEGGDPRAAVANFLDRTADHLTHAGQPRGCLFANSVLECTEGPEAIARAVASGAARLETALYAVTRRALAEGWIRRDADPRALARFYAGVAQGMAVMAKVSGDDSLVRDIARTALDAWPGPVSGAAMPA